MDKIYIVIEHTNGELDNLWVIKGLEFAEYLSSIGYLVYEVDLLNLICKEIIK